ncbi:MAG: FGGY family carbohydrate kinase [Enterocloster clostridioformis]
MLLLDVAHKRWSEEMMEMCGITRKQLPDLYESYQVVGNLEGGTGKGAGIHTGCKNHCRRRRQCGCRCEAPEPLGRAAAIFPWEPAEPSLFPAKALRWTATTHFIPFDHADGHFHLMGCMLSAASCNKWWMEEILKTKEFSREQEGIVRLGENHVFYLPYLMGERSPS